jgi:hypothetical protein
MGIPQVPEQVRRAPTLALRAVFAGIGRILLAADRPETLVATLESGTAADLDHPQRTARRDQLSAGVPPAQASSRWRSLDQTGNVRLLSATDLDDDDFLLPVAAVELAAQFVTQPPLPLANYDSLSLASIRARLRSLDIGQLKVLLDYEAVNAERPDVLGMFERRIEKLESAR